MKKALSQDNKYYKFINANVITKKAFNYLKNNISNFNEEEQKILTDFIQIMEKYSFSKSNVAYFNKIKKFDDKAAGLKNISRINNGYSVDIKRVLNNESHLFYVDTLSFITRTSETVSYFNSLETFLNCNVGSQEKQRLSHLNNNLNYDEIENFYNKYYKKLEDILKQNEISINVNAFKKTIKLNNEIKNGLIKFVEEKSITKIDSTAFTIFTNDGFISNTNNYTLHTNSIKLFSKTEIEKYLSKYKKYIKTYSVVEINVEINKIISQEGILNNDKLEILDNLINQKQNININKEIKEELINNEIEKLKNENQKLIELLKENNIEYNLESLNKNSKKRKM